MKKAKNTGIYGINANTPIAKPIAAKENPPKKKKYKVIHDLSNILK